MAARALPHESGSVSKLRLVEILLKWNGRLGKFVKSGHCGAFLEPSQGTYL